MEREEFGLRLREERRRLNLSAQALADTGGVSRVSQSHYETGRSQPDASYLSRVQRAGVDTGYLLTGIRFGLYAFDWALHDRILHGIDQWLEENEKSIPFKKKMRLLEVLMKRFSERSTNLDAGTLEEVLRLVA